ncbi:MAG TPA: class I SAM-dependent methyltransferase [Candidatus Sulfotelmatobacter sp.]|jgi:ubiquinone/menaquinone biosynthesis C-methylase UbiE|nr:class I SAM-dependent methyltransferase [Candidatus Sulfotelmatobacter sp.]
MTQPATKPYIGMGMEGFLARWYAKSTQRDLDDFRRQAAEIAAQLAPRSQVLEVAPGPGYFAIELARRGDFRITGLDISHTFVEIARADAKKQSVAVDFRQGNASAMPFEAGVFDFIFCRAAFKNFSQPVEAMNEMHRVLKPGGKAMIVDLRKDVSLEEINAYVKSSGRNWFDSLLTRWIFRSFLIKRAYTTQNFQDMAHQSRFGRCTIDANSIGLNVRFEKSP